MTEEVKEGEVYRYLSQKEDVDKVMADQGIEVHSEVECPMPDHRHIGNKPHLLDEDGVAAYRSLVGSMGWFAISMRWDVAHAVSRLQSQVQAPTEGACDSAVRVAAYLKSTTDFRLGGKVPRGINSITCHSDSDYAGDSTLGSKSHSGAMILMNGIPIHWRSKKQPKTVLSPAAAEIYACSEAVRELRWVYQIAQDMGIEVEQDKMRVQVDNRQVISFKYGTCAKTKLRGMISNRWNWVKELKEDGVEVEKVGSKQNMADTLTKCLDRKEYKRQVQQILEF